MGGGVRLATLSGVKVAMIGGDERELILLRALLADGAHVFAVGYPKDMEMDRMTHETDVIQAVSAADVVIAPMSNTDEEGVVVQKLDPDATVVLDADVFNAMGPNKPLFIGMAKPIIETLAARFSVRLIQTADLDEVAILNSIPTAEGAIQRAMAVLPVTLHGSRVIVVGFGRCGMTLARMLHGIGARVRVVARDTGQLARAFESGVETALLDDLANVVGEARAIFNTIPARVITRRVLEKLRTGAVVIDIASSPGGTDFNAARELGVESYLDLGIPGKVAPETAGDVLARTLPRMIKSI